MPKMMHTLIDDSVFLNAHFFKLLSTNTFLHKNSVSSHILHTGSVFFHKTLSSAMNSY